MASLLHPFFPFRKTLEEPQRRNPRPPRACALGSDNPTAPAGSSGVLLPEACACPNGNPSVGAWWAGCCLEIVILAKGQRSHNPPVTMLLVLFFLKLSQWAVAFSESKQKALSSDNQRPGAGAAWACLQDENCNQMCDSELGGGCQPQLLCAPCPFCAGITTFTPSPLPDPCLCVELFSWTEHPASPFVLSIFSQVLETADDSCWTRPRPTASSFFCWRVNCKFHKRFQWAESLLLTGQLFNVCEGNDHTGATEEPSRRVAQSLSFLNTLSGRSSWSIFLWDLAIVTRLNLLQGMSVQSIKEVLGFKVKS